MLKALGTARKQTDVWAQQRSHYALAWSECTDLPANYFLCNHVFANEAHVRCQTSLHYVGFEVFTAVTMKNAAFWDLVPRGSCNNRRFGGTGRMFSKDGGNTFLRNVGSYKTHTAPHPRRRHSSLNSFVK
jgi:hypothetical protein